MSNNQPSTSLRKNRFFRNSLISTVVAVGACLSTHLLTLAGVTVAVAWFDELEHAFVIAALGGIALTIYAVYRHRRGCRLHGHKQAAAD